MMSSGANFALVPQAGPVRVPKESTTFDEDDDDHRAHQEQASTVAVRQQLTSIYESYAILYPNADLAQERQERDMLLRAVSAASSSAAWNQPSDQKRGFFGFLFGSMSKAKEGPDSVTKTSHDDSERRRPHGDSDNGRLVYRDKDDSDNNNNNNNTLLCGTIRSLDTKCIPPEAHAMARFHLTSTKRYSSSSQDRSLPKTINIARTAWERPGTTLILVVGLGVLVEQQQQQGKVMYTSDRRELLEYCQQQQQQQQQDSSTTLLFRVDYTRAALIGPNLLLVSWGFTDGHVVLYRRLAPGHDGKDWQAVATIGPTPAVVHQVCDVFDTTIATSPSHDNDSDDGQPDGTTTTPLLRVTDIVPLVVEQEEQIPAATVAIARLGGFIELVPLPHAMWYGPELNVPTSTTIIHTKRRKRRRRQGPHHYAAGWVPNLAGKDSTHRSPIQVVTTRAYHTDVLALDAFRTSVEEDVVWDKNKYPDAPPAEYVLAATGTREGRETLTFWSVCTIYKATAASDQPPKQKQQDPIGFTVVAQLSEALDLGPAGPDVSIFATNTILEHWRKSRVVELRPDPLSANGDDADNDLADNGPQETRVTSISTPAPMTSVRFLQQNDVIQAAVLDWNGGVSIFDCALLERATSHSLEQEEYELLHRNADPDAVVPLVRKLNSRTAVMRQLTSALSNSTTGGFSIPVISSMEWFGTLLPSRSRENAPLVAVVTVTPNCLHLVDPTNYAGLPVSVELPPNRSTTLHRFQRKTAIRVVSSSYDDDILYFSSLDQVEAQEIVRTLARENKLQEAITASQSLGVSDQMALADVIHSCKQQLWETKHDFHCLEHITDNRYVVDQALKFSALDEEREELSFDLFRRVQRLALQRLSNAPQRLGPTLALGGLEGVEAIIDSMRERFIKVGTYELLCRYFGVEPSFSTFCAVMLPLRVEDLAISFARASDISALSLICFRHRFPCLVGPWVLDSLPLTLDVETYQHLLPVAKGIDLFLEGRVLTHISKMPSFIQLRFGIESTLGEEDERVILANTQTPIDVVDSVDGSMDTDRLASLEEWYVSRLKGIETFLSIPRMIVAFADIALFALGIDTESPRPGSLSPRGEELWTLRLGYNVLSELFEEQGSLGGIPSTGAFTLEEIVELETMDLLGISIGDCVEPVQVLSRFKRFFLPLVGQKTSGASGSFLEAEPESVIFPFCAGAVSESSDGSAMQHATALCSAFVVLSRSDVPTHARLIKKKESTMSFVVSIIEPIFEGCSRLELSSHDCRHILENLWTMYESLPVFDPSLDLGEEYAVLSREIDSLFPDLVTVDLLYRWVGRDAFLLTLKRRRAEDPQVLGANNKDMVAAICKSFLDKIEQTGRGSGLGTDRLLRLILQDLDDIRRLSFEETHPLLDTITDNLLIPLLRLRHIQLLGAALAEMDQDWINKELLKGEVDHFVNDMLASGGDEVSSENLKVAIDCQDMLREYLDGSKELFGGLLRDLEAANFINTVLLPHNQENAISPGALRRKRALDTLAELLSRDPFLSIHGTPEWQNPVWAAAANESIRDSYERSRSMLPDEDDTVHEKPPQPPGDAILHLARLLGITQDEDLLPVKLILVQASMLNSHHGAAAALSRTLLLDALSCGVNCRVLSVVADIVSNESFQDSETKRELCELVLANRVSEVTLESSFHFERIVSAFVETEASMLGRSGLVTPVVAFERLRRDTISEYSVDLAELFTTLRNQALELSIDDELLNTLARYTVFWCIAQSTRPKHRDPIPFDFLAIQSNLSLACALIVHIGNPKLKSECCTETKITFEQQRDSALEQHQASLSHTWVKPEESTVSRLVRRGYSELGARRAVAMTGNKGFDPALQWAVLHCLDSGFDSPIVVLNPSDKLTLNIPGIEYMSRALEELLNAVNRGDLHRLIPTGSIEEQLEKQVRLPSGNNLIVHSNSRKAVGSASELGEGKPEPNLSRKSPATKKPALLERKPQVGDSVASTNATVSVATESSFVGTNEPLLRDVIAIIGVSDAPLQSPGAGLLGNTAKTNGTKSVGKYNVEIAVPGTVGSMGNGSLSQPTIETRPMTTELPSQQSIFRPTSNPEKGQQVPKTFRPARPPPHRKLDLPRLDIPHERSTLRERGEAALKTARSTSQSPSRDDRKRLIEEGRRLLQKARSASGSTPKASVPLSSPVHRRPLRSRVTRTVPPSSPPSPKARKQPPRPPASTPPSQRQAPPPPKPQEETFDTAGWDFDEGDLDL